jgi:enoyl-CoA hydratase/carnithine racemase
MADPHTLVLYETQEDVAILTLNDPEAMNALSDDMRQGLRERLEAAFADNAVRSVVLTGAGGNFSAGADLRQLGSVVPNDPNRSRRRILALQRSIELIAGGPKPVVCAVEGVAFGAALSLALASDYFIISANARLGATFGKVGLTADCGLLWSMPQRIGRTLTRDILFTARPVKAAEAISIGLADQQVEVGTALSAALTKAAEYRSVAPLTIAALKSALVDGPGSLSDILALEREQQPMLMMSDDHAEGIAAFWEKRAPQFTGQ